MTAKKPAVLESEGTRHAALSPHRIGHKQILEGISANWDRSVRRNPERPHQPLIIILNIDTELVAVLQLGIEAQLRDTGLEMTGPALDVVEASAKAKLPHRLDRARSRPVFSPGERTPKIFPPQETDFRIEVVPDEQVVNLGCIEVTVIGKDSLITRIVPWAALGLRTGVVAIEVHVIVERQCRIDAVDFVRPGSGRRHRPACEDRADGAPPQDVALDPHDGKVGSLRTNAGRIIGLDVHSANAVRASLPAEPATGQNGNGLPTFQTDTPAKEQRRHVATATAETSSLTPRPPARAAAAAARGKRRRCPEVEDRSPFEEKLAFLRKEQTEPR